MQLLSIKEITEITGLAKSTVYRYVAEGHFPKPVQLNPHVASGGAVRWTDHSVFEWIQKKLEVVDA